MAQFPIEEVDGKTTCPVEEGGDVVFGKCTRCRKTLWDIQPEDPEARLEIIPGGVVEKTPKRCNIEKVDDRTAPSIRADKSLQKAVSTVMDSVRAIVFTICACVLVVVGYDAYRNTLSSKDLFPLVTAFLQTAVTILMGVLFVGLKRRNGG